MRCKKIPVIDLKGSEGETESWLRDVSERLYQAFSTTGCAFLINHGVSEHSLKLVYKTLDEFRALPDDVKDKYQRSSTDPQGYLAAAGERLSKDHLKENKVSFQFYDLEGMLPKEIGQFRDVVENAVNKFLRLTNLLLRIFAVSLGIDPKILLSVFDGMFKKHNLTAMRMLYYPPIDDQQEDGVTRCGEHTDYGAFTLVAQNNGGGLEVMIDDEWSEVEFQPGALLLMAADITESWTDFQYKAVRHRVVIPSDVTQRSRGRHSIAFFVIPNNLTPICPSFFTKCQQGVMDTSVEEEDTITTLKYMHRKLKEASVEQ